MRNKIYTSFDKAVQDIQDGASVMMMSFAGPGGVPQNLIWALKNKGARDLEVMPCPNMGFSTVKKGHPRFKSYITPDILVENGQVKKGIVTWGGVAYEGSHFGSAFLEAVTRGEVEGELVPLGVYAYRLRAVGMGAFYSPIGVGTPYEKGKEKKIINGKEYLIEYPLSADFGFIRAYKADKLGNLIYRGTARGFNPLIAKAARLTIAEVDEIVEPGEIDPEHIITPGIFVDRIVKIAKGDYK